jgi:hypothetical protein
MAPEPISTAYFINPSHQSLCVYMSIPLSLLDNGSVKTLPRQRIQATVQEFLGASFSMRSVPYQRNVVHKLFPEILDVYIIITQFAFTKKKPQVVITLRYEKMAEDFIFTVNDVNTHLFLDEFPILTEYHLHVRCK